MSSITTAAIVAGIVASRNRQPVSQPNPKHEFGCVTCKQIVCAIVGKSEVVECPTCHKPMDTLTLIEKNRKKLKKLKKKNK